VINFAPCIDVLVCYTQFMYDSLQWRHIWH